MVNSSTIYLSQIEDIIKQDDRSNKIVVTTDKSSNNNNGSNLSKKVAQNRAAQRAFRERKQHYINELESKVKQLDVWKRTVIQLQADNECLRRTITDLESELKHYRSVPSIVSNDIASSTTTIDSMMDSTSINKKDVKVQSNQKENEEKLIQEIEDDEEEKEEEIKKEDDQDISISSFLSIPIPMNPLSSISIPIQMNPSSSTSITIPNVSSSLENNNHQYHQEQSINNNTIKINHSTIENNNSSTTKRKPTLSKREKKRQRLLEDEKLYKYDDFEPIQLHCPTSITPCHFNSINIPTHLNQPESFYDQQLSSTSTSSASSVNATEDQQELSNVAAGTATSTSSSTTLDESSIFLLSSPPSSIILEPSTGLTTDLSTSFVDNHDQYINFIDDNIPSSSSTTSSSCSSPFLSLF